MTNIADLGKPPRERGLRALATLSGVLGFVGAIAFAILAFETNYATGGIGMPSVAYGSHVNWTMVLWAVASLANGAIWSFLLSKFAEALDSLQLLHRRLPRE